MSGGWIRFSSAPIQCHVCSCKAPLARRQNKMRLCTRPRSGLVAASLDKTFFPFLAERNRLNFSSRHSRPQVIIHTHTHSLTLSTSLPLYLSLSQTRTRTMPSSDRVDPRRVCSPPPDVLLNGVLTRIPTGRRSPGRNRHECHLDRFPRSLAERRSRLGY